MQDCYSFGVLLDERSENGGYRYGFQGSERDEEVKGSGNSYNFGSRMYDSRVGRWISVDPVSDELPSTSPYNSMENSPIMYLDPDGEKVIVPMRLNGGFAGWFKVRLQMAYRRRHDPVYAAQLRADRRDNNLHIYWSIEHKGNGNGQYNSATWRNPTVQQVTQGQIDHNRRYSRIQRRLSRQANNGKAPPPQINYEYRPVDYVFTQAQQSQGIPNTLGQSNQQHALNSGGNIQSFVIQGQNFNAPDRVQVVDQNGNMLFDTANLPGAEANGAVQFGYNSGRINVPASSQSLTVKVNGARVQPGSQFNYNINLTEQQPRVSTTTSEGRRRGRQARRNNQIPNFQAL